MKITLWVSIVVSIPFISLKAQSEVQALSTEKISRLIPDKIKEYYQSSDSKSKFITLGNLHYSMAERVFSASRNRSIKILLFDYNEARIMYNQATRKWSSFISIESDSLILRPTVMNNCTGWESYNVHRKNSQILLGICDRFFMTVEGTNVDLESLKKIVQSFKFETFPKLEIASPKFR